MLRHPFTQVAVSACLAVAITMNAAYALGADTALASTLGLIASSSAIALALGWTERDALRRHVPRAQHRTPGRP